jgi:hypothetical protein
MKHLKTFIFALLIITQNSCQKSEDQAMKVVDDFIKEVNNNSANEFNGSLKKSREALNYSFVTPQMEKFIRVNFMEIPENESYKLTVKKKVDNTIIVTAIGKKTRALSEEVEMQNQFLLTEINGQWKISDSYGLLAFHLNFQVEDTQWESYWDLKKASILTEIIDNLKLEVINKGKGYGTYFGDVVKGNLKLINNSTYDIKGMNVLIEHFDKNGVPVNTDIASFYHLIKSKGYREFDWISVNCSKCVTQSFAIKFLEETFK